MSRPDGKKQSRYTEIGVSNASVSAGRAEPIDESHTVHIQTVFFESNTRTAGSNQGGSSCPRLVLKLYPLAAFQTNPTWSNYENKSQGPAEGYLWKSLPPWQR